MKIYDVLIIGAGPAGLTAGLYSARKGLKTGIISKEIGGTANSILLLENWPGFNGSGKELMQKFYNQLKKYQIDFLTGEIKSIQKKGKEFIVKAKEEITAKAIVLATGTTRRKLGIAKEQEFLGKGVSYCVECDAFFFKDKIVGVIGGSDCAINSALSLSALAKKVYVFHRGKELTCEEINKQRVKAKKNVEIFLNTIPLNIIGKEKVSGIKIQKEKETKEIELDGIFIEIGDTPFSEFAKGLKLRTDKDGYIIVDETMKTSTPGIFAAGDITNRKIKQIIVASGQGAIAAKSVYDYLRE